MRVKKTMKIHVRVDPAFKHMVMEKVEATQTPLSRVLRRAMRAWVLEEKE